MTWDSFILGEVINLNYGKGLPSRKRIEGDIPVYGSSGVVGSHKEPLVSGPGIIVGRKGTVGSVYWENKDFFPIDTVYYVSQKKDHDDFRFIYYLLKSLPLSTLNTDAAVPGLNRENALRYRVQIPSPEKQKEIASILSAYDDLIENNHRRIRLLEESARLLYREWFVRLRFPGHENVKIIDGVPDGWEKSTVSKLGDVVTGKTPSTKDPDNFGGKIPFIKTPDMHKNPIIIETSQYLSEKGANSQAKKYIPEDSIIVSCIGTVGIVAINAIKAQTNQQINTVIPQKEHFRYYAYFALGDLKSRLEAMGGGATMVNVNKGKFESLPVVIPSDSILQEFHEVCNPMFLQIKNLLIQNQKLKTARDLLLPRLMNGETEV